MISSEDLIRSGVRGEGKKGRSCEKRSGMDRRERERRGEHGKFGELIGRGRKGGGEDSTDYSKCEIRRAFTASVLGKNYETRSMKTSQSMIQN